MSIKIKEPTEASTTRLAYEILVQSIELASVPKNVLFSLEFTKGSISIDGNKKFSLDELTRKTDVNETFSFFQDQGGTLSVKDKQAEILLLMWKGDRYAIVATFKMVLQVCAYKSAEAPFFFDNGDSVFSKIFYSVKCRKHIITPEMQIPSPQPETRIHRITEHPKVEGRDSSKKKIEQNNGKVVTNERAKSAGKTDRNNRNLSLEANNQQQQQYYQKSEVLRESVDNLKSPRQPPGDSDSKSKQVKNPVLFKSFWRINIDRALTSRPQTERNHVQDSNQHFEFENGKSQQISLPQQEVKQSLTPDTKSAKSNAVAQQLLLQQQHQQQQQKQAQKQQQQISQSKQKGDLNQVTPKPSLIQSQLVEEKGEQITRGNAKKGIIDATKKQTRKDIQNVEPAIIAKKDRNGIVSPNMKIPKNHEIKSTHDKTNDSINANIFLTPRTKTPTPTPRPVCYSSQQSSESSAKNSFFSEQSSCNNVPSTQKQVKGQETQKINETQKRHHKQEKINIHKEIITQLLGETAEETNEKSKGDNCSSNNNNSNYIKEEGKTKKKGAFISAEIKKKIQQLSQNISEHTEDYDESAVIIQTPISQPPSQIVEEEPEQKRPSLTRMKDFKIKKLSEIQQIEAMISQMRLEGERNFEVEGHNSTLETVGADSTQAHQESHIEIEDETIPSEGESAEEDSPTKPAQLNYQEKASAERQNESDLEEQKQEEFTADNQQTKQQQEEREQINSNNFAELSLAKHALLLSHQEKQLMTQQIDILRKQNAELSSQVQSAAHNYIRTLGQLQSENAALALRVQSSMSSIVSVPAVETEISLKILKEQNNELQKEQIVNLETIKKQQDQISQYSREIAGMKIDAADKEARQAQQIEAFKKQIQYLEAAVVMSKNQQNPSIESATILRGETNQLQQEGKNQLEQLNRQVNQEVAQNQDIVANGVAVRLEQENHQLTATISGLNEKIALMSSQLLEQQQQLIMKNQQQTKQAQQIEKTKCEIGQDEQVINSLALIESLNSELLKVKLDYQSATQQLAVLQEALSKVERENKQLTEEITTIKNQQTSTFGKPFSFEGLADQHQQQLLQAQLHVSFSPHQGQHQEIPTFSNVEVVSSSQPRNIAATVPANSIISGNTTNKNENVNISALQEQSRKSEINLKLNKELLAQKQQEYDKLQNLYSLYYQKAQNLEQINQNLEFELLQTKQDFCEALNVAFEHGGNELLDIIEKNASFREYKPKISEFR